MMLALMEELAHVAQPHAACRAKAKCESVRHNAKVAVVVTDAKVRVQFQLKVWV